MDVKISEWKLKKKQISCIVLNIFSKVFINYKEKNSNISGETL